MIGALRSRNTIAMGCARKTTRASRSALYIAEARQIIESLRAHSAAPILIDNLPEPTVQPLGFAERGLHGHRNRFRRANLALEELAEDFADVHVVDIAAALQRPAPSALLDDGLRRFTHFGSPGWMLQRPGAKRPPFTASSPTPRRSPRWSPAIPTGAKSWRRAPMPTRWSAFSASTRRSA